MKQLLFISALFICNVAIADTITLNWGVDNSTYDTTTCTVGGDVILPTAPTKRGHVFRGWQEEHFNRGIFVDWATVPTSASLYSPDYNDSRTPLDKDYITLEDASGFVSDNDNIITFYHSYDSDNVRYTYYDAQNQTTTEARAKKGNTFGKHNELRLEVSTESNSLCVYAESNYIVYNYVRYNSGDQLFCEKAVHSSSTRTFYISSNNSIASGTWRFVYDGVWETDGKAGWKPDVQISNSNE